MEWAKIQDPRFGESKWVKLRCATLLENVKHNSGAELKEHQHNIESYPIRLLEWESLEKHVAIPVRSAMEEFLHGDGKWWELEYGLDAELMVLLCAKYEIDWSALPFLGGEELKNLRFRVQNTANGKKMFAWDADLVAEVDVLPFLDAVKEIAKQYEL